MKNILTIFIIILFFFLWASVGWATNYYVNCDLGTGSNDGTSPANAWKTIGDITGISNGDDVYFYNGSTCSGSEIPNAGFDISWKGLITNQSIVGCYTSAGVFTCATKPIIDGDNTKPTTERGLVDATYTSYASPGGYLTIENLHVRESAEYGILIKWGDTGNVIQNNYVFTSNGYAYHGQGIILAETNSSTITGNEVVGDTDQNAGGIVVSSNGVIGHADNNIVSYNSVHMIDECINVARATRYTIVEGNEVYNCNNVGIYMDQAVEAVVRYNLVYADSTGGGWSTPLDYGIHIENEAGYGGCVTDGNIVHGNMIANAIYGIGLTNQLQRVVDGTCTLDNNKIYNNTIIDSSTGNIRIVLGPDQGGGAQSAWSGNVIQNNISWTKAQGSHVSDGCDDTGFTWGWNLWDEAPSGTCNSGNDPDNAAPGISTGTDFTDLTAGAVTGEEFKPTGATANGYNEGHSIASYNDRITASDFTANPPTVTTDTDDADFWVGAWMYGAGGISAPDYPLQGAKLSGAKYN